VVDILFLLDILIIFNSAYFNEDFQMIMDRNEIAKDYLNSWFLIDLVAIIPFDRFIGSGGNNYNGLVRITRIGRMYKLLKLMRLFRTFKMVKEKNKILHYMQKYLNIGVGMQRLIVFGILFVIITHIVACLWIITASFANNAEGTWMEGDIYEMGSSEKYLTSIYFTVTTITTVGYGDVSISTKMEKVFCVTMMLFGVITFSYASGSLASILQSYDI
jgi:hypothetical protein